MTATFDPTEIATTDEEMREALVQATGAWGVVVGNDTARSVEMGEAIGQIFDHWLAKRDMDIYDQAYAHGFIEGSEQDG